MKKILISPIINLSKHNEVCYLFKEDWIKYLKKIKFELHLYSDSIKNYNIYDGLIIPGTGDIFKISKKLIDKKRDNLEKNLIEIFSKKHKPILTVCRGMLNLSSINGSTLKKVTGHVNKNHSIDFLKDKMNTNSFHNFAIRNKPNNFDIIGLSKDNIIEAIYSRKKNIFGIMFHPERKNISQSKIDKNIINFFNGSNYFSSR